MYNYFEVLGVSPEASVKEIKRSFRKKIKELHPDLSASAGDTSAINHLLNAYKILTDDRKREEYRRLWKKSYGIIRFNYRDFLKGRVDDLISQSKLVFYDLLNDYPDEAIGLYEKLTSLSAFRLENHLDYADYLECIFLVSEEYLKRGSYLEAYELLRKIYFCEQNRPFFRNYMVEIIDRMKLILGTKLERVLPWETYIQYLNEMTGFQISPKDVAFLYKRMAEIFISKGDSKSAIHFLKKGMEFYPRLPGFKKLMEKMAPAL
jgi:tetratricopeptide (TPR) repeat protein